MVAMIKVDIFSDPICPWCFIGKRRFEKAQAARPDVTATVRWRTFQLNPTMPPDGMERQTYLSTKFGSADHASQLYDNIRQVGAGVGIDFAFDRIDRTPNTVNAHRLIRFADRAGAEDAAVEALFRAYFLDGRDIGDIETLTAIALQAGLDKRDVAAYLARDEDGDKVQSEDLQARRLGIQGVPCFIIADQYAVSGAQEPEAFFPLFDMVLAQTASRAATAES
jgi:predicted DsbA family dithiol-disulfide isomerase